MQYGFRDFGRSATTVSPSIRFILNGNTLDSRLTSASFSFQTLTVSGRGTTGYNVETTDIYGMHGSMLRNTTLMPRTIVVRAMVRAENNESYREGMEELNALIRNRKIHALRFTDDSEHTYYGTCQSVQDEGEYTNRQVIEMEFTCTDPYKYTEEKTITTTNAQVLNIDSRFAVVPEEIVITFNNASDARSFSMNNTADNYRIVFNHSGSASSARVFIRQRDNFIGFTSGINHIAGLNVRQSQFDEFTIRSGDQIVVTPTPVSTQITYRGARL